MKQRVSDREWHGKENPRSRYAVPNPRCLVRGSSRRMKDNEVRPLDQPSNISLMTVELSMLSVVHSLFHP